jgi:ankyrin repeat protein
MDQAAQLRAAAGEGRLSEITALLARGVAVDAADEDGETALMKAVQQNQAGAAALLRRRGASLDRKNRAGDSARDMAGFMGEAELNRALGLAP